MDMGQLISFEGEGVARLRDRLGEAEQARERLIAFARGHCAVTGAIHEAIIEAGGCRSLEELAIIITRHWPHTLGVDAVALALNIEGEGLRFERGETFKVDSRWVDRAMPHLPVDLRESEHGDPLFGRAAGNVRSEAAIRIEGAGISWGVLLVGQSSPIPVASNEGLALLHFLGRFLGVEIDRLTR